MVVRQGEMKRGAIEGKGEKDGVWGGDREGK